jgi:hypothetical protein
MDSELRDELLAMAADDQAVRARLAADGSLFQGYHPEMAAVHRRNGERLDAIIAAHGWPGRSLVGEDGARAAWLVLQHAIGAPSLQRRGLALLRAAAARGEVPAAEVAMLEDRICFYEGRPQVYGTQFDWDEHGDLSPWPIEDRARVDERRRSVGLPPLEEHTRRVRSGLADAPRPTPEQIRQRRAEAEAWSRAAGWRDGIEA